MKIDFSQIIKRLDGAPMKNPDGSDFLLRDAATIALDANFEDDKRLEAKDKYRRGALAMRIYGAKEPINLDINDLKLVKDQVGRAFGPHVVKEAWDLLDPPDILDPAEGREKG
jgi:hypothetical protein